MGVILVEHVRQYNYARRMVGQNAFIAVYMMSNKPMGTLYVGVTSRLLTRVWEHREGAIKGFTQKYDLKRLVWFEAHERMDSAIAREKEIKRFRRDWKLNLIAASNPHWNDLYPGLMRAEGYKMPSPMLPQDDQPLRPRMTDRRRWFRMAACLSAVRFDHGKSTWNRRRVLPCA